MRVWMILALVSNDPPLLLVFCPNSTAVWESEPSLDFLAAVSLDYWTKVSKVLINVSVSVSLFKVKCISSLVINYVYWPMSLININGGRCFMTPQWVFFLLSFTWLQFICGFTELQFIHCPYSVIFHWLHIHRLLYVLLFMDIWLFTESCYFSDSHLLCMVYRAPHQSPLLCPLQGYFSQLPNPFCFPGPKAVSPPCFWTRSSLCSKNPLCSGPAWEFLSIQIKGHWMGSSCPGAPFGSWAEHG